MPMNGYGTNPGYAPYNRPPRPVNTGNAYIMQQQTHRPMTNINVYQAPPHLHPPVNVYQVPPHMLPPVNANQVPPHIRTPVNVNQVPPHIRPPGAYGHKRAVLCGINYEGHKQSLDGSINDVLWMKRLLVGKLGFPNSSVLVLTGITRGSQVIIIYKYLTLIWIISNSSGLDILHSQSGTYNCTQLA